MRQRNQKTANAPDLSDVLQNFKDDIMKSLNAVQVGQVEAFNASRQTVSVKIAIKQVIDELPDGTRTFQEMPLMMECPMIFLGGGDAHLTMPIQQGDSCIVLFNDRDIDNWFIEGGIKAPNTKRKHDLSDAFAIVGVRNLQNALTDYPTDAVRLRYDEASQLELETDLIKSTTALFQQVGNMLVTGGLSIGGTMTKEGGGTLVIDSPVETTGTLKAGNGTSGTFTNSVTVVDGIVTGGT